MYFIQMVNISNGQITDSRNIATVETREEGVNRITGNSNAIFIKGEDSYYDYAILTNIDITMLDPRLHEEESPEHEDDAIQWFKYNRTEEIVHIETEEFGPEDNKKVLINIEEVYAPEGFENYRPSILG